MPVFVDMATPKGSVLALVIPSNGPSISDEGIKSSTTLPWSSRPAHGVAGIGAALGLAALLAVRLRMATAATPVGQPA
jgi:hypothetical protein